ncbi:hypothetical protein [Brachybacterium endophyticum]|nr:hypothetical protein [Brachybacterium endophyticum]
MSFSSERNGLGPGDVTSSGVTTNGVTTKEVTIRGEVICVGPVR